MKTDALTRSDFIAATRAGTAHRISRPSLSYWQDAWARLKQNRQALVSLWLVAGLAVFTTLGPVLWPQSPSRQNLAEISIPPTLGLRALVVEDEAASAPPSAESVGLVAASSSPRALRLTGTAHTRGVTLGWDALPGAEGYVLYRNEVRPSKRHDFGLPLAELQGALGLTYRDRLSLEPMTYFYTVVPIVGGEEAEAGALTLEVPVRLALRQSEAKTYRPDAAIGQEVRLPAHPLGTDYLGRDLLARIISGARVSQIGRAHV